ncbi:long-chain-fatty-acid--CoA ligase [Microbacteriaceae bacterium K1510]|nr:long-chain-fatty-acid--CoA ligase [Microbacteriaceae bacterium K1510]
MNLRDIVVRNALLHPNRDALVFEGARITYADFARRAFRLANALLGLGLRAQERVAVLAPNCPAYLELFSACESAGLVVVNLNHRLASRELVAIGHDCEPAALIFHSQFKDHAEALMAAVPSIRHAVCIDGPHGEAAVYEEILQQATDAVPPVVVRDEDIAYLIYTSGTTGKPKGVMLSHRAVVESARAISLETSARTSDTMLIVMPMFHIGGRIEQLSHTIVGATIVLHAAFDPVVVLRSFEDECVTAAHLAPIMVQRLLDCPELDTVDRSALRSIHYASAPMPVPTLRRAVSAFGPILTQIYGMTESIIATLLTPEQHMLEGDAAETRRLASAGQAFLGCKIRIARPDGSDADVGEIGEILVQGPGVMSGYWNNSTATANALRDGWFYTGDLGLFDDERFVFVMDRKKDMIISGGENIYSWEVEEALRSHAAVGEAAVIGVPDPEWGESVKAFVVVRDAVSVDDLIAHCRANIASYKKPKSIEFVDALPRLFNGKIDKKALRAPFWNEQGRQV